jgi:hypothetical protein
MKWMDTAPQRVTTWAIMLDLFVVGRTFEENEVEDYSKHGECAVEFDCTIV